MQVKGFGCSVVEGRYLVHISAQRGSHTTTLGPKYIPDSYMKRLGNVYRCSGLEPTLRGVCSLKDENLWLDANLGLGFRV